MKNFTRKKANTYIKNRLKQMEKQGLNVSNIIRDKTVEYFAYSQKRLKEFKHNVQFEKERPWREKTNKSIDKRWQKNKQKNRTRMVSDAIPKLHKKKKDLITDKTSAIMKFNHEDLDPTPNNIAYETKKQLETFLKNRYFKSTSANNKINERLEKLIDRFGSRLDLAHDFIDEVSQLDFNYEIDGVVFNKDEYISDFAEEWDDMMEARLDKMENILSKMKYRL